MPFQQQVYVRQPLGKAGTISRLNPLTKLPLVTEGTAVYSGKFCFEGTDPELQVIGTDAAATAVRGFVVVERYQAAYNLLSGLNSLLCNEGEEVAVVLRGYCYAVPTTVSTHGQIVIANPTTGEIQTLAADGSVPSGFINTGWLVETGGAEGQVCEIYRV